MRIFKTLQEIADVTKTHQVTAQELLNERTYIDGEGWVEISITDSLRREIAGMCADIYGGRCTTRERVARNLYRERRQHWGLSRTVLVDRGNGASLSYIVGQYAPAEYAEIRKALK